MGTQAFRGFTRQQKLSQPALSFTSHGQTVRMDIPQVGFLGRIVLRINGTVTTSAGAVGSWVSYLPNPFNLIRRIRLVTSEGVVLWDTSGWGCAVYNQTLKRLTPIATDVISYQSSVGRPALFTSQTGAIAASTAYTLNGILELPVYSDLGLLLGLIMLQTQQVRCTLELTFAQQAEYITLSAGSISTIAINVNPMIEVYSVPDNTEYFPDMTFVHQITEETVPITANGDHTYQPPLGNVYERILVLYENNSALISPANLNTVEFRYAQAVTPYSMAWYDYLADAKLRYGQVPPDGCFYMDMTDGLGMIGLNDPMNWLNTAAQSDARIVTNISGITPSSGQARVIKEQLAMIG